MHKCGARDDLGAQHMMFMQRAHFITACSLSIEASFKLSFKFISNLVFRLCKCLKLDSFKVRGTTILADISPKFDFGSYTATQLYLLSSGTFLECKFATYNSVLFATK